jgi:hypothetical protein
MLLTRERRRAERCDAARGGIFFKSSTTDAPPLSNDHSGRFTIGNGSEKSARMLGHRKSEDGLQHGPPAVPARASEIRLEEPFVVEHRDDVQRARLRLDLRRLGLSAGGEHAFSSAPSDAACLLAM